MSKKNRIIIIGDAMIDTYIYGNVNRVSPEAPVPVICPSKEEHCLGGAANVARNAAALGAAVKVMFIVGRDEKAEILKEQLEEYGVDCSSIVHDEGQHTINKMRVIGNNQQITRIDFHDTYFLSKELETKFLDIFQTVVESNDIVIISDYGKGMCTESLCQNIIRISRNKKKPVIVDPKGINWDKYYGASVITPNLKEMISYSGISVLNESMEIENYFGSFNRKIGIEYLLLTRSECGMSLIHDKSAIHIPAQTHRVYDVSGAGDTVVAALAAMVSSNLDNIEEAVRIANIAAGIVVSKPGTAVVTKEEIIQKLPHNGMDYNSKIYTLKDYNRLASVLKLWRTAGERIVTTNGCFDILHRGHVKLLEEAASHGERLIVAINSDASVKRLKGDSRPLNNELDRAYVISAIKWVDAVVIFDPKEMPYSLSETEKCDLGQNAIIAADEAPMSLMCFIAPDIHVKGGDYKREDIPEGIFANELVFINLEKGYSTTNIIHKIASD